MKIILKFQARPQHVDALEKALRSIIEPTRATKGCVQCDLHPSLDRRLVFFFDQLWENQEMWEKYKASDMMQEFDKLTEGMIDIFNLCVAEH